jgi:hypothetical protein
VVAGAEIQVATAREELSISLSQLETGSSVIFELPGFTSADSGAEQASLDALRDASDTSYYVDGGTLWVKLVVADNAVGGGGRVAVADSAALAAVPASRSTGKLIAAQ